MIYWPKEAFLTSPANDGKYDQECFVIDCAIIFNELNDRSYYNYNRQRLNEFNRK